MSTVRSRILYSASGEARAGRVKSSFVSFGKDTRLVDNLMLPERLPAWLSPADLDHFVAQFERSGFRGPINWYRNLDRNWAMTPFLDGAKILQPTIYATGSLDVVLEIAAAQYEAMETNCTRLVGKHLIPGAGHWIQQERPTEINELLTCFLTEQVATGAMR
jgi:pimeloyl-ACP methyl ester carboxylesterase